MSAWPKATFVTGLSLIWLPCEGVLRLYTELHWQEVYFLPVKTSALLY